MARLKISLAAARVNAELTQETVAERLSISPATLSKWEKGQGEPTLSQFNKLADMYGISIDDIRLPIQSI